MTKTKSTKRALLVSALSLLLCVSMLIGTTYAWFTDSVTSMNNIIKSGNLDVELEYYDGDSWEKVTAATNVFEQNTLWEPGHTEVVYLKVSNLGTLALKYNLGVNIVDEIESINVDNKALRLSDYIEFGAIDGVETPYAKREDARKAVTDAKILSTGYTKAGEMEAGEAAEYVALVVYMPETVGNEANYKTGEVAPQITLGLNLMATQYTSEEDNFDNQYDKDAGYDQGKSNVGPYKLNVLSGGKAVYDEATKTYNVTVDTVAQGGYNATQGGKYYAGYTVNVAGYGEGATLKFDKNGSEVTWKLADEERDGFINNGVHQQWTSIGTARAYRYDIDGDGVTDFTVNNDVSNAKLEVSTAEQLQKAITNGLDVVFVNDITVDKWIMFSEKMSISNGNIITVKMDGLTIDGNGHTLTVNAIESAGNGNSLFNSATNLNIYDLTIKNNVGAGGIGLNSGVISNVTFIGGGNIIYPGTGEIKVENCTFNSNGNAFYNEHETDNLTVTGCTFNLPDNQNVILLRGDVKFTNNTINSGRTVNIVSGSPVVTGNNFNDVRLKVYAAATATVSNNTINNLVFDAATYASTFADNTLSTAAQAALNAATKA